MNHSNAFLTTLRLSVTTFGSTSSLQIQWREHGSQAARRRLDLDVAESRFYNFLSSPDSIMFFYQHNKLCLHVLLRRITRLC